MKYNISLMIDGVVANANTSGNLIEFYNKVFVVMHNDYLGEMQNNILHNTNNIMSNNNIMNNNNNNNNNNNLHIIIIILFSIIGIIILYSFILLSIPCSVLYHSHLDKPAKVGRPTKSTRTTRGSLAFAEACSRTVKESIELEAKQAISSMKDGTDTSFLHPVGWGKKSD